MAKLRHIAITVPDPEAAAAFYEKTFGMQRVGTTDSSIAKGVYLSDGTLNMAILKYKSEKAAGADKGLDYVGVHHFGFWADDVDEAREKIEANGGKFMMGPPVVNGNAFYEMKFTDPNGIIFDVNHTGWVGAKREP